MSQALKQLEQLVKTREEKSAAALDREKEMSLMKAESEDVWAMEQPSVQPWVHDEERDVESRGVG